jgi:penicillin amidase
MVRKRAWLRRLIWIVLALVVAAPLSAWLALRSSLPRYEGEARVAGFSAPVDVERDALGVASIAAATGDDAYRALGYVHGQERYFEMDLMRRSAAGELSALIGRATLPTDRAKRLHRMRNHAREVLARASAAERTRLDAYVAGVNAGLDALGVRPFPYLLLRASPEPWQAEDSILVLYAMFFDLVDADDTREQGLAKLARGVPPELYALLTAPGTEWDAPLVGEALPLPPLPTADQIDLRKLDPKLFHGIAEVASDIVPGSNSFAVDGTLSDNGAAMVANDMHLSLRVPNIWFRARIRYRAADGGDVDLIGVTLPGVPSLVAGSNRHIAWGFTNSYGDWADLAEVHWLDPAHTRYRARSGPAEVRTASEQIAVKGADPDVLQVRETEWGPIVAEAGPDTSWAVAWTAHDPDAVNMKLGELDLAPDVDAALSIAHRAGIPPQNFLVGDSQGHIAWTIVGRIPVREGYDASLPADWSRPGVGWNGWLAPERYPVLRDPEAHRLWTANNRTQAGAALELLGNGGYALGARAKQIRDDLFARDRFRARDLLEVQLDDRALFLERWWRLLHTTLAQNTDPALADLKRATAALEPHAAADSRAYRLVRAFRTNVHALVLDALGAPARAADPGFKVPALQQAEGVVWQLVDERPPHLLAPTFKSWDELLLAAARRVVEDIGAQPGGLAARTWGERNTARIQHPLSRAVPQLARWLDMPADRLPGDGNMPRVQGPGFGASERFAVAPGHEQDGYFHMPGGQSGHPLSPYYGAGHEDWVAGRATPFLPGAAQHTMRLVP